MRFYLGFFVGILLVLAFYVGPQITGNPILGTRLVVVDLSSAVCNITFVDGWNLVSFPCITTIAPDAMNISYDTIMTYSASDANDPWKSHRTGYPSWVVHDLSTVTDIGGYYVQMDNTSVWYINNTLETPNILPLVRGWNLIGFPSRDDEFINDTFNDTIPDWDLVYLYNATNDRWTTYSWDSSQPSTQDLNWTIRQYAYWIQVNNPHDLVIS